MDVISWMFDKGLTDEAALRDARHGRLDSRLAAVAALGQVGGPRRTEAVETLRQALADEDPRIRAEAALALGEQRATEAAAALVERCADEDDAARQGAVIALGRLGDPSTAATLARCCADPSADVRFQAVTALALVAPPEASAATIEPLLEDPDAEVRGSAAAALGDLGHRAAADAIAALLDDEDGGTRVEAAVALARLDDPRAAAVLAEHLAHRDFGVLAAQQLFERPAPTAAAALREQLGRWLCDPVVRIYAAGALARLGEDGRARTALTTALDSGKPNLRGLAIQVLAELLRGRGAAEGDPETVSWARQALERLRDELERRSGGDDAEAWREELERALLR